MNNPLSRDDDFIIPLQEAPSGSFSQSSEDIEYFLRNLWKALKVPKEFLEPDK